MARVVQEACVSCKYGDCVEVCPVDCFFQEEDMLVIHPEECIDCEACEPECPVSAIVPEDEAEDKWIERNANVEWDEKNRLTKKSEVNHGPNRDPDLIKN